MLSKVTVNLYAWIIEIYLWFTLLISGVVGYYYTVPALHAAGAILENEAVWKIYGAVFFAVATFLMLAVLVGPFLMLVDIRKSVRALATKSSGSSGRGLPAELKEPFL